MDALYVSPPVEAGLVDVAAALELVFVLDEAALTTVAEVDGLGVDTDVELEAAGATEDEPLLDCRHWE